MADIVDKCELNTLDKVSEAFEHKAMTKATLDNARSSVLHA